jgi:hypothetical protein
LPEISFDKLNENPTYLVQLGLWRSMPKNFKKMLSTQKFYQGRKIFILIPFSPELIIIGKINKNLKKYDPTSNKKFLLFTGIIKN